MADMIFRGGGLLIKSALLALTYSGFLVHCLVKRKPEKNTNLSVMFSSNYRLFDGCVRMNSKL